MLTSFLTSSWKLRRLGDISPPVPFIIYVNAPPEPAPLLPCTASLSAWGSHSLTDGFHEPITQPRPLCYLHALELPDGNCYLDATQATRAPQVQNFLSLTCSSCLPAAQVSTSPLQHAPPPPPLPPPNLVIHETVPALLHLTPPICAPTPSITPRSTTKVCSGKEVAISGMDTSLITFFRLPMSSAPFWMVSFSVLILFSFFFS